ncbi:MAG: hypothetical protein RSC43_00480 [Clostridia bacterium]
MSSVVVCIYGTPRIAVIKRLGYMTENGKAIPRKPWDHTKAFFGQKCLRIEFDELPKKEVVNTRVNSLVTLGRFINLDDVRIIIGERKVHYPSLEAFLADTGEDTWKAVEEVI